VLQYADRVDIRDDLLYKVFIQHYWVMHLSINQYVKIFLWD